MELRFVTKREKKKKKKNQAEFIPRAFPSESPRNKARELILLRSCVGETPG